MCVGGDVFSACVHNINLISHVQYTAHGIHLHTAGVIANTPAEIAWVDLASALQAAVEATQSTPPHL